jgi:hypothetical protein
MLGAVGLIDRIRAGEYAYDGSRHVVPGRAVTLAEVARAVAGGADLLPEARDFLDGAGHADDAQLALLVAERPEDVDERTDALVAALAEHVLAVRALRAPAWTREPGRFLDRFWFVSGVPGLRATALAQTPIALKRRGILWPARSLERI